MAMRHAGRVAASAPAWRAIPWVRVAVVATVATASTTMAPWARSGNRVRTSYDLVEVVGRAGVVPDRYDWFASAWLAVPALCGLVLVMAALGRRHAAAVLATTLGALVGIGGVLVLRSPLVAEFGARGGTVLGAVTVLAGVLATMTTTKDPR